MANVQEEKLEEKVKALGEQIEHDRSLVADCLTKARAAVTSRDWLTEGRGCYEWNDDRWHAEFASAAQEFLAVLEPMAKVARDWKDCPQSGEEIAQARIDLKAEAQRLRKLLFEFRTRAYTAACRPGASDHSTACLIWGDDGQGHAPEFPEQALPCNCGALLNHERGRLSGMTAMYKEEFRYRQAAEAKLAIARKALERIMDSPNSSVMRVEAREALTQIEQPQQQTGPLTPRKCWNCGSTKEPCHDGGTPWCVDCGVVDNPQHQRDQLLGQQPHTAPANLLPCPQCGAPVYASLDCTCESDPLGRCVMHPEQPVYNLLDRTERALELYAKTGCASPVVARSVLAAIRAFKPTQENHASPRTSTEEVQDA